MTTITQQFNKPNFVNAVDTDLTAIRDNFWFLIIAAANGSVVAPGWVTAINSTSSPVDYGQPDNMTLSYTDTTQSPQVTYQIKVAYTWTSGNVTGMVVSFSDGSTSPLFTTVTGGTITLSYDGSGNFTGATTA